MTLSEELQWRGFVNQTTLTDIKELDRKKFKLYFGVDPTSDSMQVGNLAAAMMVRCFHKHGHDVTLLVGGATGMIGDPSGKDAERNLLTPGQVVKNKQGIVSQYKQIFKGEKFRIVDNYDWFKTINYLDFLRDVGKYFSLTPLLQRDYIAARIGASGNGMSYAEFSYTLIQGYDYYHLHQTYGTNLQVCGSDQWGNSLSGVELIRRKTGEEVHVYSVPLVINKTTGKKFGKSEDGAIWLDPKKTTPSDFYQFWINVDDDSVGDYLKVFTELDKEQIASVMTKFKQDKSGRLAQKTLAYEVTNLAHGRKAADDATTHAGALGQSSQILSGQVAVGDNIIDALVKYGLASSKTEARQIMEAGGIYINNEQTVKTEFEASDFRDSRVMVRRGKALKNTIVLGQR